MRSLSDLFHRKAVREETSVAVREETPVAVREETSVAVRKETSVAMHGEASVAAAEPAGRLRSGDSMDMNGRLDENAKFDRLALIARSFNPSAPIDSRGLSGRDAQITEVINACMQRGQHVIIFGERGAGKTSLATSLIHVLGSRFSTLACGSINCDQTTTFASLWKAICAEIPVSRTGPAMPLKSGQAVEGTLAQFLPENITPDAVRAILQQRDRLLIVIDEIDRIADKNTTTLLADTIKSLSDHSVDVTLVLVGVAESVDALIAEHESVQRALIQVHMPRMTHDELAEIIHNGLQTSNMTIEPIARQRIIKLSQGLPHYTHLLTMHAAQSAATSDRRHIVLDDTHRALEKALKHAQQSVGNDYYRATFSSRGTLYPQVLLACALVETDNFGYFNAADVARPLSVILQKHCEVSSFAQHLNALCLDKRGPALQGLGTPRAYSYKFKNAILRPFVIMQALETGMLSEERMAQMAAGLYVYPGSPGASRERARIAESALGRHY